MRLIIDIPEEIYKASQIVDVKYEDTIQIPLEVISNSTPISDNATNGDIVLMMIPNASVYKHNGGATYSVHNEYNFNATWWNAPYQKGASE